MRTVTPTMNRYLHSRQSTEPILIVGLNQDGSESFYSDKEVSGAKPYILSSSSISDYSKIVGSGSAKSITITFDDASGVFEHLMDHTNLYMCECNVYQCFGKLSIDDKFLLFTGNLCAPIEYDTAQKTLTVQVLTDVDKKEVGVSSDDGYFGDVTGNQTGLNWPLMFGEVCREKTTYMYSPYSGVLNSSSSIPDPSLPRRLEQAKKLLCPKTLVAEKVITEQVGEQTEVTTLSPSWDAAIESENSLTLYSPDPTCVEKRYKEICSILTSIAEQNEGITETLDIYDGNKFTQGVTLDLIIKDATFTGHFSGNTFHISNRIHPDTERLTSNSIQYFAGEALTYKSVRGVDGANGAQPVSSTVCSCSLSTELPGAFDCEDKEEDTSVIYGFGGGSEDSWRYYYSMPSGKEFTVSPGDVVLWRGKHYHMYIVSIVPGTIQSVSAYKKNSNKYDIKTLVEIPSSYYTVQETEYGDFTAIELVFEHKLSDINQQWEDDVYVSFSSDVGPHALDVIEWIVDNYSDYEIDSDTFDFVRPYLENYPVNFALFEKTDLWKLLSDIAYQVRCEITLRGKTLYITYLPLQPTPVMTIDASKVKINSLTIGLYDTNDLITNYEVNWTFEGASIGPIGSPLPKNVFSTDPKWMINNTNAPGFTLKHNLNTYGDYSQAFDYYVLNDFQSAFKTATFWLIRKANVYKTLKFRGPLELLLLEHGDCVTVDLATFSSSRVPCIVESTVFDYENNEVEVELTTPVKEGDTEEYYWYWPAYKPAKARFPLPDEDAGPVKNISVPESHIFSDKGDSFILSYGDPYPSDVGDNYPDITCYSSAETRYLEPTNYVPILSSFAQESFVNSMTPKIPNLYAYKQLVQNRPDSPGQGVAIPNLPCTFDVMTSYVIPSTVAQPGQSCKTTGKGMPCESKEYTFCHKFMNLKGAKSFITNKLAEIGDLQLDGGRYEVGVFLPTSVIATPHIISNRETVNCSDPAATDKYFFYEATKALLTDYSI